MFFVFYDYRLGFIRDLDFGGIGFFRAGGCYAVKRLICWMSVLLKAFAGSWAILLGYVEPRYMNASAGRIE